VTADNQQGGNPSKQHPNRSIVYIDGFNLYNGSVKGTAHKWLNLQKFFEKLRMDDEIQAVKYFTAKMDGEKGTRQQVYLNALQTLSKVEVIAGWYKKKTIRCHVRNCGFTGKKEFPSWEEKRTDVNIAIHILDDAYRDLSDKIVVVSGDSDLVPALLMVRERFPNKVIIVYVPASNEIRGAAVQIRSAADKNSTLPTDLFAKCQLPSKVDDGAGGFFIKPSGW